jgi:hypothetical protein
MFKLLRKLIVLAIIAGLVFVALSLWQGGEPFRWFGKESEKAGEVIKKKSEEMGNKADEIKKKTDNAQGTTKKVVEGIRKAGDKVRDITGLKDEK